MLYLFDKREIKLGFLTRGMRHALSVMRQKSLQHITVGMIPYIRYRCALCGMLYAACGMRQIESLQLIYHQQRMKFTINQ